MHAVIIGGSGGVGAALTTKLAAQAAISRVSVFSRRETTWADPKIQGGWLDLEQEDSIAAAAALIAADEPPSLVIVATGLLSSGSDLQPEKTFKQQDRTAFERVFSVNTIGPAMIAKHFIPLMPRQGRAIFAVLSARVGSISDNRLGGWHAYRASKAALNMLIKNYALEQARRNPDFIAVGLHPGTVDTPLSAPFQKQVPEHQLFSPQTSAAKLLQVIADLESHDSGSVFDWAGKRIPA